METKVLREPCVDVVIKSEKIGTKTYYIAHALQIDVVAQGLSIEEALENLKEIIKDRMQEEPSIKIELETEEAEQYPFITRICL